MNVSTYLKRREYVKSSLLGVFCINLSLSLNLCSNHLSISLVQQLSVSLVKQPSLSISRVQQQSLRPVLCNSHLLSISVMVSTLQQQYPTQSFILDNPPSSSSSSSSSQVPIFTLTFITIYLLAYFTIFKSWSHKTRPEASSCLISLAHGTPAALLSLYSISSTTTKPSNFASPNTPLQNTTLDFSIAYFLIDTLHYALFSPSDYLFIAHHLAVLYVFLTCRYVVCYGAFGVLGLLVLAEITSACQNVWSLAGIRKAEEAKADRLHGFLSPLFYGFYTVVRGILAPLFVCRMMEFYVNGGGDGAVPWWAWVSWMVVIVGAILVSALWVLNNWATFFRQRAKLRKLS